MELLTIKYWEFKVIGMKDSHSLNRFHKVILTQGTVTLLVFTIATCAVLLFFRNEIRNQILNRDGALLTDVAQHFHERAYEKDSEFALIDVALESSEIRNVIGVSLYSPTGENIANIPLEMYGSNLASPALTKLQSNEPVTTYYQALSMDSLFSDFEALLDSASYPITEVLAPLLDSDGQLIAVIQYWLDGAEIAHELNHLDRFLILLGAAFIIGGGIVFFLVFYISRNRLLSMGRLLAEQNRSLKKANADLAMAARTSAIGSISSHLFHGLKNPLAGLKAYLQLTGHDDEVLEVTNRMQNLIDESLSVIREEDAQTNQVLSMEEFLQVTSNRLDVTQNGKVRMVHTGAGSLPAQKVQLLLLVLRNLVDNALEAAPESPVLIDVKHTGESLSVSIRDSGLGLPDHVKEHLFDPVISTKENGTGIGLAISSVIARHIPAELQLVKSDPSGTTFSIELSL